MKKLKEEQKSEEPQGSSWVGTAGAVLENAGMMGACVPGWGWAGLGTMIVGKGLSWLGRGKK